MKPVHTISDLSECEKEAQAQITQAQKMCEYFYYVLILKLLSMSFVAICFRFMNLVVANLIDFQFF